MSMQTTKRIAGSLMSVMLAANYVLGSMPGISVMQAFAAEDLTSLAGTNPTTDVVLLVGSNPTDPSGAPYGQFRTVDDAVSTFESDYFLGIASQFCVFLNGNFTETNSDAEGRVAIGGDMYIHDQYKSYAIAKGDYVNNVSLHNLLSNNGYAGLILGGMVKDGQIDNSEYDDYGVNQIDPVVY